MPVTFTWNHVVNPQSSGYELQIARDAAFTQIEADIPQLNGPSYDRDHAADRRSRISGACGRSRA